MKSMKKNLRIGLLIALLLLTVNQIFYLCSVQFTCTDKINRGQDLNNYKILSAYQTHTALWLFGWIFEPSTACACFKKQFHLYNFFYTPEIPEDDMVRKAKVKLLKGQTDRIRLTWSEYSTRASIYLNGSYISRVTDEEGDFFWYEIPLDYKPGIINIHGVTLSETVFDYLENIHVLTIMTDYVSQKVKK